MQRPLGRHTIAERERNDVLTAVAGLRTDIVEKVGVWWLSTAGIPPHEAAHRTS